MRLRHTSLQVECNGTQAGSLLPRLAAGQFCSKFKEAADEHRVRIGNYHDAFEALCKTQPRTVLETFFGDSEQERRASQGRIEELSNLRRNPLDVIPDDEIETATPAAASVSTRTK